MRRLSSSSLLDLFRFVWALAVVAALVGSHAAAIQSTDLSPEDLVRLAVAHETAASQDGSAKHMFRARKQSLNGAQTRLYVETTQAMAGMTIAYDDKPISEQQIQGELQRLQHLIADPNDLRRKQKQEHEDAEHTLRIVKALPDAFLYEFDGTESSQQSIGKPGDELVRLKFHPNPHYTPPTRVEQVLTGMQGTVLIDRGAMRLARISATLFRQVGFGWGILGHLDKGGGFLVEQADVGDGTWDITHMQMNLTGKIMLFKSLAVKYEERFSDFRQVPKDLTFAQGVDLLKQEWTKLQNGGSDTAAASRASH